MLREKDRIIEDDTARCLEFTQHYYLYALSLCIDVYSNYGFRSVNATARADSWVTRAGQTTFFNIVLFSRTPIPSGGKMSKNLRIYRDFCQYKRTVAVFVALFAVALAAPQLNNQYQSNVHPSDKDAVVVKENHHENIGVGNYGYSFELSNGHGRQEQAEFVAPRSADEEGFYRVTGSFSYVDPATGQSYTVNYVADENGFQPTGAHLPQ
uniref:Uncharacterized protein n=1 Tax=Trichogramma kaykai TaxID=54128 RepID=A0ABD2WP36_9HYME